MSTALAPVPVGYVLLNVKAPAFTVNKDTEPSAPLTQ
jgi:hypothetical protein